MKIAGVVAEYNPFHAGHALHLRETRRLTGCDRVIAVMSSSFVQRGRAAAFDKFTRTRAALQCGADAVFELPALYALKSAEGFASAGVSILARLGADVISCGVERDAEHLADRIPLVEPECVSAAIRARLASGEPYAGAWGAAMAEYLDVDACLLRKPNLMLMLEYRRAAAEFGIPVCGVPRNGDYHDIGTGAVSAEAVRAFLDAGDIENAAALIPEPARFQLKAPRADEERLDAVLLWLLRCRSIGELAAADGCCEGLEYRLYDAVRACGTVSGAAEAVKTKRYTRARIDRLIMNAAFGITSEFSRSHARPGYARLLGFRRDAREILTELDRRSGGFMVTDPGRLSGNEVFGLETRATDLWFSCCSAADARSCGMDHTQKMIII